MVAIERHLKENTLKLVVNSNLCIFSRGSRKYKCVICKAEFLYMKELRAHCANHKKTDFRSKILLQRHMSLFKADISNLECVLCLKKCTDLYELKKHLSGSHSVEFHHGEPLLVPFVLFDELFECVVCESSFTSFTTLSSHMSVHFRSFVCDYCGASFYNHYTLKSHVQSSHCEQRCRICKLEFSSSSAKEKHRQSVHHVKVRRYCPFCKDSFKSAYKKLLHMIEAHGVERPQHRCNVCAKTFLMKGLLSSHVKSMHQRLKPKCCHLCPMRFYRATDLRRHELTHSSDKSFSCCHCGSAFKSKDSLNRHLKCKDRCMRIVRQ